MTDGKTYSFPPPHRPLQEIPMAWGERIIVDDTSADEVYSAETRRFMQETLDRYTAEAFNTTAMREAIDNQLYQEMFGMLTNAPPQPEQRRARCC